MSYTLYVYCTLKAFYYTSKGFDKKYIIKQFVSTESLQVHFVIKKNTQKHRSDINEVFAETKRETTFNFTAKYQSRYNFKNGARKSYLTVAKIYTLHIKAIQTAHKTTTAISADDRSRFNEHVTRRFEPVFFLSFVRINCRFSLLLWKHDRYFDRSRTWDFDAIYVTCVDVYDNM